MQVQEGCDISPRVAVQGPLVSALVDGRNPLISFDLHEIEFRGADRYG